MPLTALLVLHRRKGNPSAPAPLPASWPGLSTPIFRLETCLRDVWIVNSRSVRATLSATAGDHFDRYEGTRAYEFLLRVGCGLDSEIKGESDVFGQLREAWRVFEKAHPVHGSELAPVMQRVFEDVKEVRSRHLRALGTVTYGGLTRRLLGEYANAPTLLVGAGHMARAVVPYLSQAPLEVWNRTSARTQELLAELPAERVGSIRVLASDVDSEMGAWRRVTNVIVCVPQDRERDDARIQSWREASAPRGRLIHLGLLSSAGSAWNSIDGLATLDDLFGLQAEHNALRDAQLARAGATCREKAKLRSLGGPLSLAHGWEDLSLFASAG